MIDGDWDPLALHLLALNRHLVQEWLEFAGLRHVMSAAGLLHTPSVAFST